MYMGTYEVTIRLTETGRNLNILMAAPSPAVAMAAVRRTLHEIGVKAGREYDADEVSVVECTVEPA
jgi:hypothetical protein